MKATVRSSFLAGALALLAAITLLALAPIAWAGAFEDAAAALESAWKGGDYQKQVAAVERVLETKDPRGVDLVIERGLTASDQFVFERSRDLLVEKTDAAGRAILVKKAGAHAKKEVRVVLVRMMGALDAEGAVGAIEKALKDSAWEVICAGIRAAREKRVKALISPLIAIVGSQDGRPRRDAIDALGDLTGSDYGKDAQKWATWWASVEAGFTLKPPTAGGGGDGEGEAAKGGAGVSTSGVETAVREGLYEIRSKRTLFVVDISASMEAKTSRGTRLEITKKELKRVISDLGDDMLFNVLVFSDKAKLWKPKMVQASSTNRGAALKVIDGQKADGMTATHDALQLAFTLDDVDTIYFLSDGFPTVGKVTSEEILKSEVRRWNRAKGVAIHTIAFVAGELKGEREDKDRAKAFMRELAQENGGSCKIVE